MYFVVRVSLITQLRYYPSENKYIRIAVKSKLSGVCLVPCLTRSEENKITISYFIGLRPTFHSRWIKITGQKDLIISKNFRNVTHYVLLVHY